MARSSSVLNIDCLVGTTTVSLCMHRWMAGGVSCALPVACQLFRGLDNFPEYIESKFILLPERIYSTARARAAGPPARACTSESLTSMAVSFVVWGVW